MRENEKNVKRAMTTFFCISFLKKQLCVSFLYRFDSKSTKYLLDFSMNSTANVGTKILYTI